MPTSKRAFSPTLLLSLVTILLFTNCCRETESDQGTKLSAKTLVNKIWHVDPHPTLPFSSAVKAGGLIYISGQLPIKPGTVEIVGGNIEEQTRQCCENIKAILAKEGLGLDAVVKNSVFLAEIKDYAAMNRVYTEYFKSPAPARACVAVKGLALGALVEIESIACFRKISS